MILVVRAELDGSAEYSHRAERVQADASAVFGALWQAQSGERAFEQSGREAELPLYDAASRGLVAALDRTEEDAAPLPSLQGPVGALRALVLKDVARWDRRTAERRAGLLPAPDAALDLSDLPVAQRLADAVGEAAGAAAEARRERALDLSRAVALAGIAGGGAFAVFLIIWKGRLRRLAARQADAIAEVIDGLAEHPAQVVEVQAGGPEVERLRRALETVRGRLAERHAREALASEEAARSTAAREAEIDGLRARVEVATALAELATRLTACASAREVVETTQRLAPALAPGCRGVLFVREGERRHLVRAADWNQPTGSEDLIDSAVCWGLRLGRVHLYQAGEPGSVCPHVAAHRVQTAWCAPLIASGEAVGLLYLEKGETRLDLTLSDVELAADAVAAALANVYLHSRLGAESIRDPLTGLFNRRHLEATLEVEIARARRSGAPLSMVMIDLDRFKSLNDSHGHELGDLVLMALAETLQSAIRKHDLACRYGGEEFMLLLPDTSQARAGELAERIRKAVRAMDLNHIKPGLAQITASFGVASLSPGSDSFATLLRAADRALYAAKAAGRDRVVHASPESDVEPAGFQPPGRRRVRPAAT